ncbi:MAG: hypothetical protein JWN22_2137 [Nocardioides sp.]|nr:hypothetical protein [Nocardioides sp.]
MSAPPSLSVVDPFDLPEWLGESEVTWTPEVGVRTGHHVVGRLSADDRGAQELACDLLAVDEAYPSPVADDQTRLRAHQAWRHGQILLVDQDRRLTLAVPGTGFTADLVLDALSRLAKAVGASPDRYAARLRIGAESPRRGPSGR